MKQHRRRQHSSPFCQRTPCAREVAAHFERGVELGPLEARVLGDAVLQHAALDGRPKLRERGRSKRGGEREATGGKREGRGGVRVARGRQEG